MPSLEALCRRLRLMVTQLNYLPVSLDALKSPKQYRIEAYGAYIEFSPGRHSRRKLGDRLGVSGCTTRAYDEPAGVEVTPQFKRTPVTRQDVERYSGVLHQQGPPAWFEDTAGNRYPYSADGLLMAIAFSQGGKAYHVVQTMNHYAVVPMAIRSLEQPPDEEAREHLTLIQRLTSFLDRKGGLFS